MLLEGWHQFLKDLGNPRASGFPVALLYRLPWLRSGRAVGLVTYPAQKKQCSGGWAEEIVLNSNPLLLQTRREVHTLWAFFRSKLFCTVIVQCIGVLVRNLIQVMGIPRALIE